jgi:hypothetical protein
MHDIDHFPRGPEVVASGRLGKGRQAAAGKRYGTVGAKLGHASLPWACSAAAGLLLRDNPAGPQEQPRVEHKHGQGQALTRWAHPWARAVYDRLQRARACEPQPFGHGAGRGAGEPRAARDDARMSLRPGLCTRCDLAWWNADEPLGRYPCA